MSSKSDCPQKEPVYRRAEMILQSLALTGEQLTKKNRGNHLTRLLLEIFQAISKSLFQSEANCQAVKSWHFWDRLWEVRLYFILLLGFTAFKTPKCPSMPFFVFALLFKPPFTFFSLCFVTTFQWLNLCKFNNSSFNCIRYLLQKSSIC